MGPLWLRHLTEGRGTGVLGLAVWHGGRAAIAAGQVGGRCRPDRPPLSLLITAGRWDNNGPRNRGQWRIAQLGSRVPATIVTCRTID